jgi:hypothetical protein
VCSRKLTPLTALMFAAIVIVGAIYEELKGRSRPYVGRRE